MESGTGIRDRTRVCMHLFSDCRSDLVLGKLNWIATGQSDFNSWVHELNANSTGFASLDHALSQLHDVRALIHDVLDKLAKSLRNCLDQASTTLGPGTNITDIVPLRASGTDQDTESDIDALLKRLFQISTAFQPAGKKSRHREADASFGDAIKRRELREWEQEMEHLILIGLRNHTQAFRTQKSRDLEGTALSPIQRRLIRSNLLRRHRIEYAVSGKARKVDAVIQFQESQRLAPIMDVQLPKAIRPEAVTPLAKSELATTDVSSIFSSTPSKFRKPSTVVTRIETSFVRRAQDYPRKPMVADDHHYLICPYCAEILPVDIVETEARWRAHVTRDLMPYVCLIGNCQTPEAMFLTAEDLDTHIRQEHGVKRWVCDYCSEKAGRDQIKSFDTPEDWVLHNKDVHFKTIPVSWLQELSDMRMLIMIQPISCPLCNFSVTTMQPYIDEHILQHMHSFALRALPWATSGSEMRSVRVCVPDASSNTYSDFELYGGQDLNLIVSLDDEFNYSRFLSNLPLSRDQVQSYLNTVIRKATPKNIPGAIAEALLSLPPRLQDDQMVELAAPELIKICCILFQLQIAEHSSDLLGMIDGFQLLLQDELQHLLTLIEETTREGRGSLGNKDLKSRDAADLNQAFRKLVLDS